MPNLKEQIIAEIIRTLTLKLNVLTASAKAAHEAATHDDSKPENKYDTRGLEASYLAGAQAKRADELTRLIEIYNALRPRHFSEKDPIGLTALVDVICDDTPYSYFIGPQGGGIDIVIDERPITIITPASALGEALINRKIGDWAEVTAGSHVKEYEIVWVE